MVDEVEYSISGTISDGNRTQAFTNENILNIDLEFGGEKMGINKIKLLEELKEKLAKMHKQIELTKDYYKKLRDENPKLAIEYRDVIRFCNSLQKEIVGPK